MSKIGKLDGVRVKAVSRHYLTEPVGRRGQDWFLNSAALLDVTLTPAGLLNELLKIELEMGRVRTVKWGPRLIDLDILFFGDEVIAGPDLKVPHPHLEERRFVLLPLKDVAPDWIHPILSLTPGEMLDRLNTDGQEVIPL